MNAFPDADVPANNALAAHPIQNRRPAAASVRKVKRLAAAGAFSLVEVVLALGVTSFVLMALLGTLPAGVKSVKDSMNDSARANILQQIRADLENVSFGSSSSAGNNIDSSLSAQTNYYTPEGLLLTSTGSSIPAGAYYQATFKVTNASYPNSTTQFQYESAQTVEVMLAYPVSAPTSSQTQMTNYIFAAKQKNY